jgi:hypothetical protein
MAQPTGYPMVPVCMAHIISSFPLDIVSFTNEAKLKVILSALRTDVSQPTASYHTSIFRHTCFFSVQKLLISPMVQGKRGTWTLHLYLSSFEKKTRLLMTQAKECINLLHLHSLYTPWQDQLQLATGRFEQFMEMQ